MFGESMKCNNFIQQIRVDINEKNCSVKTCLKFNYIQQFVSFYE